MAAAEIIEAAHEATIDGQSAAQTAGDYAAAARLLQGAARGIAALAEAAAVIAGPGDRAPETPSRASSGVVCAARGPRVACLPTHRAFR